MRERPPTFRINRNSPPAKGLVFAALGGGAGTLCLLDSAYHGNHCTLTNMDPTTDWVWMPELNRLGLNFTQTGTNSLEHCKSNFIPAASQTVFSISFWSRQAGGESVRDAFVLSNGFKGNYRGCLRFDNNYTERVYLGCLGDVQFQLTPVPTRIGLNHWCVVRETSTCTLYRNGVSVKVVTGGTTNDFGWGYTAYMYLGGSSASDSIRQYGGDLADFLIHDRALSSAEVQMLADPSNVLLSGLIQNPRRKFWPAVLSASTIRHPWQHRRHRRMTGAA